MTNEKTNGKDNSNEVATQKDPALIPDAIYKSEEKMEHIHGNNTFVSEHLHKMLPSPEADQLVELIDDLTGVVAKIRDNVNNQLDRRSNAVGKGFRNYGFMLAANQSMNNFPQLAPNFIDINDFNNVIEDYLFARDVSERLLSISNDVRDIMNIFGNIGFNSALAYYANVRSIADRTRDKTAISVFNILRRFFERKGISRTDEPTEVQLEKDFKALLHGHKDGKIVIENENPTVSGRVHEVLDETHSPHSHNGAKANVEEKIEE